MWRQIKAELLEAYEKYAWLSCVHVHVGSQGCPMELLVQGAKAVLALATEINSRLGEARVTALDLGGGLPADYASDVPDAEAPERLTMAKYGAALREAVPEIFDEARWTLLTEFGRCAASAQHTLSRTPDTRAPAAPPRRLTSPIAAPLAPRRPRAAASCTPSAG